MEPIENTGMNKQIDLANLSDNDNEDYMKQVREYYKIDIAYGKAIKQIFDAIKEGKIQDAGLINRIKYIFIDEDFILHEIDNIVKKNEEERIFGPWTKKRKHEPF